MFQVEEFLSNKADSMKTMRSSANKILTTIAANIEWVNQHAVPLIDWFQSNGFWFLYAHLYRNLYLMSWC